MKVNSNRFNFQEIYDRYLANYVFDDVVPALDETVTEVSKKAVQRLKANSPKDDGDYAKGWKRSREKGRMKVGYTIYNEKPGLPHLLEHGHARRNGGRKVPPSPLGGHIEPVEQWAIEEAEDLFIHKIEGV